MSTASPVIQQNIEVITTLCQGRQPGSAVEFAGLLAALQTRYPATGWTSDLLTLILTVGKRQGLYLPVGSNPAGPVLGWALQPNMLKLNNPRNFLYEPWCSQIKPIGCCLSASVGSGTN